MRLEIRQVVPTPLAETDFGHDSIWGREASFSTPEYTLVEAESGSGKTTLISLLYGLRSDYNGHLELDGTDARQLSLTDWAQLRQRKLAVVLQDLRLFPELTARENLQLKNRLTNALSEDEMEQMCDQLGVYPKLDQKCQHLSLGQQQRIALIRALCQPFELLLMDEPFSHLDQGNIAKACQLIDDTCKKQNAGIVLTTLGEHYPLPWQQTLKI